MELTNDKAVELQASLMRRWAQAHRDHRAGLCSDAELADYLLMLRGIARRASEESCPHHGKSLTRRAHAYAAPIRLGAVGSCLGGAAQATPALREVLPVMPPPHEWAQSVAFGPRDLPRGIGFVNHSGGDNRKPSMMPGMHPERLRR